MAIMQYMQDNSNAMSRILVNAQRKYYAHYDQKESILLRPAKDDLGIMALYIH
jgi:hypothetical protein